jgi:hypothetical protein
MNCPHDFVEITTAPETAAGLRREICILCDAERTHPSSH